MPNWVKDIMVILGIGTTITLSYLFVVFLLPSLFFYGSLHLLKLMKINIDNSYFFACKVTIWFLFSCVIVAILHRRSMKIEHDFRIEK